MVLLIGIFLIKHFSHTNIYQIQFSFFLTIVDTFDFVL